MNADGNRVAATLSINTLFGAGGNATSEALALTKASEEAGADALLHVTPYYNRPPQEGLVRHFHAIADATDLPLITYDIPNRTGTAIELDTMMRIAEHPRIIANKDAKGDLWAASHVMAQCDLAYYSGDDGLNLALLAVGAIGVVSVTIVFGLRV